MSNSCKICQQYSVIQEIYTGTWKFHPQNPYNPLGYEPNESYCPECIKEQNKEEKCNE